MLVSELKRHRVTHVSASCFYTFAVTDRQEVFSWGKFSAGILQPNRRAEFIRLPALCDTLEGRQVSQVHAGRSHAVALTDSGVVLSWGGSELGQRGHGVEGEGEELLVPAPLDSLTARVAQLAVGLDHNLALTTDQQLVVWGYGEEGQLGLGDQTRMLTRPQPLHSDRLEGRRVVSVHCGADNSALLTDSGDAFVFGSNHHGQLGLGDTRERSQPVLLKFGHRLRELALGAAHSLFLARDGRVYAAGWCEDGRLGTGGTQNALEPVLVPPTRFGDEPVERVFAGGGCSFAVTASGRVYGWGLAADGRLGLEPDAARGETGERWDAALRAVPLPTPLPFFERHELVTMVVGTDHAVALVRRRAAVHRAQQQQQQQQDDDDEPEE